MTHKSLPLSSILTVVFITSEPSLQAKWSSPSSEAIALVVTGIVSGLLGACGMHLYHQSSYKKEVEAQREQNIVTEAAMVKELVWIDDHIFFSEDGSSSYYVMATRYTRAERARLEADLEHNLQAIEAQKRRLNEVTGNYGVDGNLTHQRGRALYAQLVAQEQRLLAYQATLRQLYKNKDTPLDLIHIIDIEMQPLLSHDLSSAGLVLYLRKAYGTHTTDAGLKGFPLICAIETFERYIAQLDSLRQKLQKHLVLVESDAHVQGALQKIKKWRGALKEMLQLLNEGPHVQREARLHTEQLLALTAAQTERNRSKADLARSEADRIRTQTDLLREQNQAAALQTRQMEAQAAYIKGIATATNRIIAACFTCPDHGTNCYHHCTHYRAHIVECSHCHV